MSSYLWRYYLEDDVERFQHLLETASYNVRGSAQKGGGTGQNTNVQLGTSPGYHGGSSPLLSAKGKRLLAPGMTSGSGSSATVLTRSDINWRDANGLTILHHAASSTSDNAIAFAQALVAHPLVDLYLQDLENSWTALHRAFYFGNITIARAILERDSDNTFGRTVGGRAHSILGLIKIKDREGHGPLDLYAATIQDRTLHPDETPLRPRAYSNTGSEHDSTGPDGDDRNTAAFIGNATGDECFTFGSNRNVTLGFGDEDDRQWPERISVRRPEHLLQRFYREHMENVAYAPSMTDSVQLDASVASLSGSVPLDSMPWVVRSRPIKIEDVAMSKLHTAVLTDDPESNLHVCGHGPGGRLGLGHEKTSFTFACVEGGALTGKKIVSMALGQNHTLVASDDGEIFSWGSNAYGQLGYALPRNGLKDEDPVQNLPRQIFGPLKRETVHGLAASRIHSVAFTGASLYTWGKNEGQLGLVDSDARSLETQTIPRKVAASLFSTAIQSVSATDKATVCLLTESHDVWVFANYGYAKIVFPLNTFNNNLAEVAWVTQVDSWDNHIVKITTGGDAICAMSSHGEVFSVSVSQPQGSQSASSSTTNPAKIKASLSRPQQIWSLRTNNMAARDVGVDADGSIVIATHEGSVWKRTRRAKIKDANVSTTAEYRAKDYKFSRVSGLTRVIGVRSSAYGAYAAIRRDCDVTREQIAVEQPQLWKHVLPLLCFNDFHASALTPDSEKENPEPRFWQRKQVDEVAELKKHLLESKDLETEMKQYLVRILSDLDSGYDVILKSSVSDLQVPVHHSILATRSRFFRDRLAGLVSDGVAVDMDIFGFTSSQPLPTITFAGIDPLTLINFALYCYTDTVIDYWHYASRFPKLAHRYRTIRTELMKMAGHLGMKKLEASVRQMITPTRTLDEDFEVSYRDPAYFDNADVLIELADDEIAVHRSVICQRCPFFEGMFMGRAGGRWLADRRGDPEANELVRVDLKHVESSIFKLVLRHIYADTGEELFDTVVSADLEEFFDVLMEVLSVANELMLDRLAQICQKVMGRYVNVRNVSALLNAVAPSSVSEFKNASLEYMCLSLEAMLHGGLLDDLDDDLLLELDERVRSNQRDCMPFVRSGRAEALLLENHPELAEIMARNRQAKIDAIALHTKHSGVENWASTSFRAQSLGEDDASPTQLKSRRRSRGGASSRQSPALKGKEAVDKLGSTYDEAIDLELDLGAPALATTAKNLPTPRIISVGSPPSDTWFDSKGRALSSSLGPGTPRDTLQEQPSPNLRASPSTPTTGGGAPWGSSPASVNKLDLRDIMSQTSGSRISNLSASLAAAKTAPEPLVQPVGGVKVSQKERKKLQQQALQQQSSSKSQISIQRQATPPIASGTPPTKASPWQVAGALGKTTSLKDVMKIEATPAAPARPNGGRAPSTPQLTLRQTVANVKSASPTPAQKIPPAPVQAQQPLPSPRSTQARPAPIASKSSPVPPTSTAAASTTPIATSSTPRSVRHQPRPVSPTIQLSMADILNQQQLEKDIVRQVKEDNAKRSLMDIQTEQEFQQWWEREERRIRIEQGMEPPDEVEANAAEDTGGKGPKKKTGGRGQAKPIQKTGDRRPSRGGGRKNSGRHSGGGEGPTGGEGQSHSRQGPGKARGERPSQRGGVHGGAGSSGGQH